MQNIRNFRPRLHFAAKYGWLNDPNGLIYNNGMWNMYFQYNPYALTWGSLHWGHAVSRDLVHWEELPAALRPYDDVYCFSGSMVYDPENTSGLAETPEQAKSLMVAFYTGHHMKNHIENQCIAYSRDGGMTFDYYKNNPVVDTPQVDGVPLSDFRDPKVFKNKENGLWTMLVAAKFHCDFYTSTDLIHWEKTGEFAHHFKEVTNVWACTDLIPFDTAEGRKWVFLASMENGEGKPQARTMYFVGDFDGKKFVSDGSEGKNPLWLDFGWDCYAGNSFNDTAEKIMTAWGTNPRYAAQTPTDDSNFCGIMTLMRRMNLVKTGEGWRLQLTPIVDEKEFEKYKDPAHEISETCMLKVHGNSGSFTLKNEKGEAFKLTVTEDTITIDRSASGMMDFNKDFASEEFSRRTTRRLASGDVNMTVIYDVCSVEVYADGGLEVASAHVFPTEPYTMAEIEGDLKI